ncbi:GABA permease [Austwickia sp. TVS 96-490-7B]|uniref:amino acid permease n=1 Tax=Austwickia sp. TVS 96-490-7B TaxID=2830843 RepID=UPI001D1B38A6|nr:amino acid permease [Austwickia sp. TVS 96-490-7B]MBW3085638.1 GABA permease [Austwickia sp. TVS 96-490-7B]
MSYSDTRRHHQRTFTLTAPTEDGMHDTTTTGGSASGRDESGGLQQGLTTRQISMIGLSGALGTGLFLGSGSMIKMAGPAIVVSYTLTGLLALIVVWSLAEMTTQHPVAGGFGASAHAYLGPMGGFLARWNVAVTMCIAVGAEVTAAAKYLQRWFPDLNSALGTVLCSLILILINLATVRLYGASEYWFSILKVATVIVFIALGVVMIFVGLPGRAATGLSNLTAHGGFAPHGAGAILAAAVMAIFSFGGAENVSVTAAESADPVKDIPKAAKAMIFRLIIFYVGAIAVVVALEPWTVSAEGEGLMASPFVKVLAAANIPGAADFMNLVLIVAALSAGNGCLYASSRMLHSLGTDRMAPASFAVTTAEGSPRKAVTAASAGMVVASVLALWRPDDAFMLLFGVLVFGLWLTWLLIVVTYLAFKPTRRRLGLPDSPVQLTGGVPMAFVGFLVLAGVGVSLAFIPGLTIAWQIGGPYLLVMLLGYLVADRSRRGAPEDSVLTRELAARDQSESASAQAVAATVVD